MNCSDYQLLIPFRRTGDLLSEDATALELHLSTCTTCSVLAVPTAADAAIRSAFQSVTVPAGLKERVGRAVAKEQSALALRRVGRFAVAISLLACLSLLGWEAYGRFTRPRIDTEGMSIVNGWEADGTLLPNLVYTWLETEKLPTDLPFEFVFKYFASRGYEKIGGAYVPVLKFQDQTAAPAGSFAKLYFVREGEIDVRNAINAQSSFCTVQVITGPKGITFLLVHTGADSAPFIRQATIPPS